jgi:hypothetical protein
MDDVIQSIYQEYKHGEILMCELDGLPVFVATHNHEDASSEIFDDQGEVIMFCNWAWGGNDIPEACYEFDGCEAIYRVDDFINGEPPVDLYGLGD